MTYSSHHVGLGGRPSHPVPIGSFFVIGRPLPSSHETTGAVVKRPSNWRADRRQRLPSMPCDLSAREGGRRCALNGCRGPHLNAAFNTRPDYSLRLEDRPWISWGTLLYVGLTVLFFGLTWAFVKLCERV